MTQIAERPRVKTAAPSRSVLHIQELGKRLGGNQILDGLNLEVQEGEIIALLGPSGSGKTTLLRCISGLESPDAGELILDGRPLFNSARNVNVPPENRNLGLVFQSYALWPHKTVAQNVAFGLEMRKVPKAEAGHKVVAVLEHLGLGQLAQRYPAQLSGGQQQRVSLARAFVTDPLLLLLDEPLSNLDAKLREHARIWLREALKESGKTAIFVTHDQAEAMAVADRVAILRGGKLAQLGSPQEVYLRPNSLFVADFMGSPNILTASSVEVGNGLARAVLPGGEMTGVAVRDPELTGPRVVLRQEYLEVAPVGTANSITGVRESSVFLGATWEHWVRVGEERLRFTTPGELTEQQITLHTPPERAMVFHP